MKSLANNNSRQRRALAQPLPSRSPSLSRCHCCRHTCWTMGLYFVTRRVEGGRRAMSSHISSEDSQRVDAQSGTSASTAHSWSRLIQYGSWSDQGNLGRLTATADPPPQTCVFLDCFWAGGVGWGGEGGEGAHDDVSSRAEAPIIKGCCASVLRWVLRSIVLVRHPLAVCQLVVEAKQTGGPLSFWLHLTRRFARHSCRQSLDLIASRLGDTGGSTGGGSGGSIA